MSPVSPTPDCITRKFRDFISGNSSSSYDIFPTDAWYEIGVRRLVIRLSTVDFTVVSLCLKESLAMPTRGRFVCHVHCLVHDDAVRSSPCRPHHENFGRNLYHMFVPAYSTSQSFVLFWVVVFELLRSQMLIPYLLETVFSYFYVNTNPSRSSSLSCQSFSTGVSLFKWIRSLQHSQDQL